jgi:DNA-binding CsgD family transcriptional regulator
LNINDRDFQLEIVDGLFYLIQDFCRIEISEELFLFYSEEQRRHQKLVRWDKRYRGSSLVELSCFDSYSTIDLSSLTPTERRRLLLRYLYGYKYVEIAKREHRSEASVKESVYRAICKLSVNNPTN